MSAPYETILEISIKKLISNFSYLRSRLSANTKIIAVVKAYAYGHGDVVIAKKLESLGVHALWVADFEEGSQLRKSGVKIPIIIANPGRKSTKQIFTNKLDVVIHNFEILKIYGKTKRNINIHIKFNTGMNRYGFNTNDTKQIITELEKYPNLNVIGLCSHLIASEDPEKDKLTKKQFDLFEATCNLFVTLLGRKIDRHILNSFGVLRFADKEYEMVRLGIGLYGGIDYKNIKQIATFKSIVADIKEVQKGKSVGYNAAFIAQKNIRVGIIPLGYADGLNRKLGEGNGTVLINKTACKIIGKISMDSCTVKLPNSKVKIGDQVIIFGDKNPINSISKKLKTIPYEIYATINRRIQRVYEA
tara:strand:+ start:673 stop:1752 length:1080 start_codon:yes stop_codon:yes gene_type:complete